MVRDIAPSPVAAKAKGLKPHCPLPPSGERVEYDPCNTVKQFQDDDVGCGLFLTELV